MVFGSANINYVLPENIEQHILDGYKLIDVREDDEWNAGHHSGANHIPMSTIPDNLNTFISIFPTQKPKYALLVMLESPKVAKDLVYNYRGTKIKGTRNEAGWNSVYVSGKIIKKIGPILAINSEDFKD